MSIHRIPMAEYIADPCDVPSLSSSIAHTLITRSPLHAWHDHPRLGGAVREDSGVADIGTVAHDLLLGGEGKICVIDPNDYPSKTGTIPEGWTNNAIRAARDEARKNGLTPILAGAMAGARAMVKEAKKWIASSKHPDIFNDGEPELTVIVKIGDSWLRCRPDWMSDRYVLHYKTTKASAESTAFARGIMRSMGYDFSMEFYRRCIEHELGTNRKHLMLVQEQDSVHGCSLIDLSTAKEEILRPKIDDSIALWRDCMERQQWPGYPGTVHTVEPQLWELSEVKISYD